MNIWVELKNINVFRIKDMGEKSNCVLIIIYHVTASVAQL